MSPFLTQICLCVVLSEGYRPSAYSTILLSLLIVFVTRTTTNHDEKVYVFGTSGLSFRRKLAENASMPRV